MTAEGLWVELTQPGTQPVSDHVEEDHVPQPLDPRRLRRGLIALGATALLAASLPLSAGAAPGGFVTSRPSMNGNGPETSARPPAITTGT